ELLVVTVATDETDGFKRFKHSLDYFNLTVLVVGMHEEWTGGDIRVSVGGGQKINLLKKSLENYKDNQNLVLFFTDSYDVIFTAGKDEILSKFKEFNANLIFSAETTIWPDATLKDLYPEVTVGKRFLCSGGIIGYAPTFWKTINMWDIEDKEDDQLYYTKIYLNTTLRAQLNATLDHTSKLVQNINFAKSELEVVQEETISRIQNTKYHTYPAVIHGNGPTKMELNYIGNYVPDGWHSEFGCRKCDFDSLQIPQEEENFPTVQIAIFIEPGSPFIAEFFTRIANLDYPKSKMTLFIHTNNEMSERLISQFLLRHRTKYNGVQVISPHDGVHEATARNMALDHCVLNNCGYQLSIDSNVQITNTSLLKMLIAKNKQIVGPLLKINGKLWSNFWGALNVDGYYARSADYISIVNSERTGIWNIPFLNSVYLINGKTIKFLLARVPQPFFYDDLDADMAFCAHARNEGIFMYVTNEAECGRLLSTTKVDPGPVHQDLWQIQNNPKDWEEKYIHPDFWNLTLEETEVQQPCPDVYMFPLFTEEMADAIVDVMEHMGEWSGGKNKDDRLAGGYENVPTVDIHMNQVNYEKEWLHMLSTYPTKIIQKVYPGYYTKAQSIMMFVVRYRPSEQSFLRPHHDSSTWTMNVALNTFGEDYEGGGCRFLRYNCAVTKIPKGYAVVHPGRLTHYHEGLETTKGTRYISVSFVDP
uniref:procollagen-lysine 5-dioxygenase n=1 Tax=Ciona savignyi TaxID=51511 RepID=H2ZIJ0_CIOSA